MSIDKNIIISRIAPFMDRFEKYFKVGYIKFNSENEIDELNFLMKQINPGYAINPKLSCNSCVMDIVTSLSNYYSKYSNSVQVEVQTLSGTDELKDEAYYESLDKRSKEYREYKANQL